VTNPFMERERADKAEEERKNIVVKKGG